MNINDNISIGELASKSVEIRELFDKIGIDYCCNGQVCLQDAIANNSLPAENILSLINDVLMNEKETSNGVDPQKLNNKELIEYIISKHHHYLRVHLPAISDKFIKVLHAHSERHGVELKNLHEHFINLYNDLEPHLLKEEEQFFPEIISIRANEFFPEEIIKIVNELKDEHAEAGKEFEKIKHTSNNYIPPEDACLTFVALYDELKNLELDLHEHIHLENNILFERIINNDDSYKS